MSEARVTVERRWWMLGCLVVSAFVVAGGAHAQSAEKFYAGRTVTLIVPSTPGGAYDITARLVARHVGRHIVGKPTIVVQNQTSGAAGIALANRFANTTENDGALIAGMLRSVPQFAIMGDPQVRFDPLKLEWLGSVSSFATDAYVLIGNNPGRVQSAADFTKPGPKIHLGANRSGSTNLSFALIMRDVMKLNVDIARGYPGAADIVLAQQRGEVDAQTIDYSALLAGQKDLLANGKLKVLVQFARETRLPALPEAPTGRELVADPRDRALLEFAELPFFMGFPFIAPVGTPAERAAALRTAFDATMADEAFLADAQRIGLPVSPIGAERVRALIAQAAATPKDVVARFKALLDAQ